MRESDSDFALMARFTRLSSGKWRQENSMLKGSNSAAHPEPLKQRSL